jgi:hypothetical protein
MLAICEDELEELESNCKPAADDNAEDDDEPDVQPMEIDDDGDDKESNTVTYLDAVESLVRIRQSAPNVSVAETVHLDRFLKALHSGNAKKRRRPTTMHSYFPKK